ncbi:MAG: Ditrans,polycis-undecaprenyl-diphosphate synthase ((2E,6E)-farnesyl-diphosphate specific) [Chlamydiales bacterium]|nr:Ditrans,polycis-undecaprenyl-diphosphate synthase ((2E,6E)-farnesyl-diphosphate specific) [Chlamydiales bacterium]
MINTLRYHSSLYLSNVVPKQVFSVFFTRLAYIFRKNVPLQCPSFKKSQYFTSQELTLVLKNPAPKHVAIIMDGNRRWAQKQASPFMGHAAGAAILPDIVEASLDLGLEVLTVFAFSTENWRRSPQEVAILLQIFQNYLDEQCSRMVEQGVRFHVIGDPSPFSEQFKETIEETRRATCSGQEMDFVVALNYGGRDDLRRALSKITQEVLEKKIQLEDITEEKISLSLDTANFRDPDLFIRTSGEKRVSNFLLWQLAYTEVYVTDTLWPDFTPRDLLMAVLDFQKRHRRVGK